MGDFSSWLHLLVITSTVFGVLLSVKTIVSMDMSSQHQLQRLLVRVAWPPAFVHWIMFIVECWMPISYAIFPPKVRSREALLNRNPITKVAYPSAMAKDGERLRPSQRFALVILAYAVLMLACSWGTRFEQQR